MPKHYPWLWFDADGTLFDFNRAEGTALRQSFNALDLPFEDHALPAYRRINQELWQALEQHAITPAVLQVRRFELLLDSLQLAGSANILSRAYLEHLALCAELLDGALDVLRKLSATHRIAIVTNGLATVQRSRLALSPIREYITELIISEEVGAAKPKPAFFDAAFGRTGYPAKNDILMIGDSLTADISGAAEYGLDTCWYNPAGSPRPADLPITYEITRLAELLHILA